MRVITAHGRITGLGALRAAAVASAALFMLYPRQMMILTARPAGHEDDRVAVMLQIIGTLIIRKLVNIED